MWCSDAGKRLNRQLESEKDLTAELRLREGWWLSVPSRDPRAISCSAGADENLFEIHIDRLDLSKSGLDPEGHYFLTFDVYDFETMMTPVMASLSPVCALTHSSECVRLLETSTVRCLTTRHDMLLPSTTPSLSG